MNGDSLDRDTDRDTADVKRWLDDAIAGEPPMVLDRADVVRQGRRRLRRRRLLEAGGAAVAVVVTALGAVLLTSQLGPEPSLPPATRPSGTPLSTTTQAPPVSTSLEPPPTSGPPSRASETEPDPRAALLTSELNAVLPPAREEAVRSDSGYPVFRAVRGSYLYEADLYGQGDRGALTVRVERRQGMEPSCDLIEQPVLWCETGVHNGDQVVLGQQAVGDEDVRRVVVAIRPKGVMVTVAWSTVTSQGTAENVPTSTTVPPDPLFDETMLLKVATLPTLTLD